MFLMFLILLCYALFSSSIKEDNYFLICILKSSVESLQQHWRTRNQHHQTHKTLHTTFPFVRWWCASTVARCAHTFQVRTYHKSEVYTNFAVVVVVCAWQFFRFFQMILNIHLWFVVFFFLLFLCYNHFFISRESFLKRDI